VFDEVVVTKITAIVENLRKEVVVCGIIHDNISVIVVFNDAVEGDDVGMTTGELMEGNFPDMNLTLPKGLRIVPMYETFDGVGFWRG